MWGPFCYFFSMVEDFLVLAPPPPPHAKISAGAHVYLSSLLPPLLLHYAQLSCACSLFSSLFSSLPPSTSLLPLYFFAYDTQCSNLQRHKSVHLTSSRYVCDKLITAFNNPANMSAKANLWCILMASLTLLNTCIS